ncbi:ATP-dependent helicase HrpB [Amycolatopsis acidiphila]|uniref:ATP-dependent helicase HrpB n=1 Tax=Amycolatopsis acidiphila TaxID=715473 RepID=A0A558AI57_9PSEU|nr:ATP-dependent helicase HrpB [Amycolatopsis acidiphila]TVT23919.1 ATP-dependent helicase HrpB [Amycolatopsis acidiphila]UIJ61104.1 ATP-dependent helicase HrpB [Amycolatopsis acidiphila]GHG86753.1 ATP-dependent helicase [Amycolatopsis acidiphila]
MTTLPDLPVRDVLGELTAALDAHGSAVLVAPPGTGKTTVVPLALAEHTDGRIVVAEPRRLAARAAASRMAALLGEQVGDTVGYAVRGDRKVSRRTRIEVVTSGLLVRRVQHDPELPGVGTVLLDECHERHLDADLLLALLLDVRGGLREDLKLLATSATVASGRLAALLGDAPVITAHVRTYPVELGYLPPARNERVEVSVARAIRTALSEVDGDVLAFLPGAGEIARTSSLLSELDADVLPLHGRVTAARQDAALKPGPRRRVVLATAVAESSLTVPGVRAVVDSGLARVPRVDHRRGLPGLATVRVSAAVAEQRAGRAGREAPGRAYRCWAQYEQVSLPAYPEPEIRTADLTRLALELACWATPDGAGLSWWDPPPDGPLDAGQELLRTLGALENGKITARGRKMADLGLHPRLARALLDGAAQVGPRPAAEVVAMLDAGGTLTDVEAELRRLRDTRDERWRTEVRRLARLVPGAPEAPDPALVVALAHPERLARRREKGSPVYLMASGTAAELPAGSGLGDGEWLAVAEATRDPGRAHGIIRLAARADAELALRAAPNLVSEVDEVGWAGDVVARSVRRLGAIVLSERPLRNPDPELVRQALLTGLHKEGLDLLTWSAEARNLRQRLAFLHRVHGEPWPSMTDEALLANAADWLGTARRHADLARIDTVHALRGLLPWPEAARLDALAPDRIEVPSGSRIRVDYSTGEPVLAVKLQETFGWPATPRVSGVPVVLHLLSPAGRPAAVTSDLESFWHNGYVSVRAELRGRYPKHPWPEDPLTATATRRTKRS